MIAYRLKRTFFNELEKGKPIRYHHKELGKNSVWTYGDSFAYERQRCQPGPFSVCYDGNALHSLYYGFAKIKFPT